MWIMETALGAGVVIKVLIEFSRGIFPQIDKRGVHVLALILGIAYGLVLHYSTGVDPLIAVEQSLTSAATAVGINEATRRRDS